MKWLLFLTALPALLVALTPPLQSDGIRYHLAAPQEILKAGAIQFLPHNAFSNFPFLPQMHYMLALGCKQPETAQIMHWMIWLVTGSAIYHIARRLMIGIRSFQRRKATARLCQFFYLLLPLSPILASWPFIDHSVSLFTLLSVYCTANLVRKPTRQNALWAALMCGGAVGCKYTGVVHVLALIVIAGFMLKLWKQHYRISMMFAAALFVTGSIWYVRNWIVTGNPVYPLAYSIFGGGDWTAESASHYAHSAGLKGIPKTLPNLFWSPVESARLWYPKFEDHNLASGLAIFLILLLFAGFKYWRCRLLRVFVFAGAAYWITWFFSYQSNRMLLPLAALTAPLLGIVLSHLRLPILNFTRLCLTALALYGWLWSTQWMLFFTALSPPPLRYLGGAYSNEVFLGKSLNFYNAYQALNREQQTGKTLLIGEHRIFYAEFPAIWSDWFDTPAFAAFVRENKVLTITDLLIAFRRHNITSVLFNEEELKLQTREFTSRHSPGELKILDQFRSLGPDQVTRSQYGGVFIYRIKDRQP